MLQFGDDVVSIAFGQLGTKLEGLLFVTHNGGTQSAPSATLTMVDLATLQKVDLATGGTRGDTVTTR